VQPGPPTPAPKPPDTTEPKAKDDTEELLKAKPDAVLKESDFAAGVKNDEKFLEKYDGKIVDITGTLKHYEFSGERPALLLDSFRYKYYCRDPNALAHVAPGQTVTLRDRCNVFLAFGKCVIVKVEGDTPPELAADKLAAEYAADNEGTEKKYKGKYVVVSGKTRIIKEPSWVQVELSTAGVKPAIVCNINEASATLAKKRGWLKEGAEVKILGQTLLGDPLFVDAVVRGPLK
jgi:hypothetical protein